MFYTSLYIPGDLNGQLIVFLMLFQFEYFFQIDYLQGCIATKSIICLNCIVMPFISCFPIYLEMSFLNTKLTF